jgi:hypothetical protein
MWKWTLALVLCLFACGRTALLEPGEPVSFPPLRDAGVPDAGLDAGRPDAGAPDAGFVAQPWICETADAGPPGPDACEMPVTTGTILPDNWRCYVDVVPSLNEVGTLRWDCDGGAGNAELIFARATFHGIVSGDHVTLCVGTSYLYADNCEWLSAQHIAGTLEDGGALQFSYNEMPDAGQTGCWIPCTAYGPITEP